MTEILAAKVTEAETSAPVATGATDLVQPVQNVVDTVSDEVQQTTHVLPANPSTLCCLVV